MFKFGVLADIQYSVEANFRKCRFSLSLGKLEDAVAVLNRQELDFTVQLGDFINRDFQTFSIVQPLLNKLEHETYSVLGNHDLCVEDDKKKSVWKNLGLPYKYYAKNYNDWKLLFLDGNDISLNAFPEGSERHTEAKKYFNDLDTQSKWWNGAIGATQLQWLENELNVSQGMKQHVLIFCHFPITPESEFSLWNREEVLTLINRFSCVKAWMNGHHHEGAYTFESGIHFVTFKGMVETEDNSFAMAEVGQETIEITGYGREESRVLKL